MHTSSQADSPLDSLDDLGIYEGEWISYVRTVLGGLEGLMSVAFLNRSTIEAALGWQDARTFGETTRSRNPTWQYTRGDRDG